MLIYIRHMQIQDIFITIKYLNMLKIRVIKKDAITWFLYKFGKFIPVYNLYQSLVCKFNYCTYAKENIKIFEECGIIKK